MSKESYRFFEKINLHVKGRISKSDADRQEKTAREILNRLERQPGLILADEVGMGKTFVALAVAVSISKYDRSGQPIVVMVPPSLKEKWPRDFQLFLDRCLPKACAPEFKYAKAERAVEFLKLLDDPPEKRKSVIFLTHGAMYRGLSDRWVKLAIIQRALYYRKNIDALRKSIYAHAGEIVHLLWVEKRCAEL